MSYFFSSSQREILITVNPFLCTKSLPVSLKSYFYWKYLFRLDRGCRRGDGGGGGGEGVEDDGEKRKTRQEKGVYVPVLTPGFMTIRVIFGNYSGGNIFFIIYV